MSARRMRLALACASLAFLMSQPAAHAQEVIQPGGGGGGSSYTPARPTYVPAFGYPLNEGAVVAGQAGAAGNVRLEPFYLSQSITISAAGVIVATAGAAGSQAVIYVYGSDTAGNRPSGLPLGQCTLTTVTSTGFQSCNFASNIALTGNRLYWLGWEINATATALICTSFINTGLAGAHTAGYAWPPTFTGTSVRFNLVFGNNAHTFGNPDNPATFSPAMTTTFGNLQTPAVFVRVASVP